MTFENLVAGHLYGDRDIVNVYRFVRMRNDYIAEFVECEYDEDKGDYIDTTNEIDLVKSEVARLREV